MTLALWTAAVVALLGVLVLAHELGHFLVAKLFGVKVLRFSLGFGPKLFSFTAGATEYRLSLFPLGGLKTQALLENGNNELIDTRPATLGLLAKLSLKGLWKVAQGYLTYPVPPCWQAMSNISINGSLCQASFT